MLCTQADIEALRQIDVTAEPDATIATLISHAEAQLEGLTGRLFGPVADEVYRIEDLPEEDGVTYLPTYPVTSLVVGGSGTYVAGEHYELNIKGEVFKLRAGTGVMTWDWQYHIPTVSRPWVLGTTFTVTGGGDATASNVPRDLRLLCAQVAAMLFDRGTVPGGLTNESLGGWAAGYRLVESDLTPQQNKILRRYRHNIPVIAY